MNNSHHTSRFRGRYSSGSNSPKQRSTISYKLPSVPSFLQLQSTLSRDKLEVTGASSPVPITNEKAQVHAAHCFINSTYSSIDFHKEKRMNDAKYDPAVPLVTSDSGTMSKSTNSASLTNSTSSVIPISRYISPRITVVKPERLLNKEDLAQNTIDISPLSKQINKSEEEQNELQIVENAEKSLSDEKNIKKPGEEERVSNTKEEEPLKCDHTSFKVDSSKNNLAYTSSIDSSPPRSPTGVANKVQTTLRNLHHAENKEKIQGQKYINKLCTRPLDIPQDNLKNTNVLFRLKLSECTSKVMSIFGKAVAVRADFDKTCSSIEANGVEQLTYLNAIKKGYNLSIIRGGGSKLCDCKYVYYIATLCVIMSDDYAKEPLDSTSGVADDEHITAPEWLPKLSVGKGRLNVAEGINKSGVSGHSKSGAAPKSVIFRDRDGIHNYSFDGWYCFCFLEALVSPFFCCNTNTLPALVSDTPLIEKLYCEGKLLSLDVLKQLTLSNSLAGLRKTFLAKLSEGSQIFLWRAAVECISKLFIDSISDNSQTLFPAFNETITSSCLSTSEKDSEKCEIKSLTTQPLESEEVVSSPNVLTRHTTKILRGLTPEEMRLTASPVRIRYLNTVIQAPYNGEESFNNESCDYIIYPRAFCCTNEYSTSGSSNPKRHADNKKSHQNRAVNYAYTIHICHRCLEPLTSDRELVLHIRHFCPANMTNLFNKYRSCDNGFKKERKISSSLNINRNNNVAQAQRSIDNLPKADVTKKSVQNVRAMRFPPGIVVYEKFLPFAEQIIAAYAPAERSTTRLRLSVPTTVRLYALHVPSGAFSSARRKRLGLPLDNDKFFVPYTAYTRHLSIVGHTVLGSKQLFYDTAYTEFFVLSIPAVIALPCAAAAVADSEPFFTSDCAQGKLPKPFCTDLTRLLARGEFDSCPTEPGAQGYSSTVGWDGRVVVGYFSRPRTRPCGEVEGSAENIEEALECIVVFPQFQHLGIATLLLDAAYAIHSLRYGQKRISRAELEGSLCTAIYERVCRSGEWVYAGGRIGRPYSHCGHNFLMKYWSRIIIPKVLAYMRLKSLAGLELEKTKKGLLKQVKRARVNEEDEKENETKVKRISSKSLRKPVSRSKDGSRLTIVSLHKRTVQLRIPLERAGAKERSSPESDQSSSSCSYSSSRGSSSTSHSDQLPVESEKNNKTDLSSATFTEAVERQDKSESLQLLARLMAQANEKNDLESDTETIVTLEELRNVLFPWISMVDFKYFLLNCHHGLGALYQAKAIAMQLKADQVNHLVDIHIPYQRSAENETLLEKITGGEVLRAIDRKTNDVGVVVLLGEYNKNSDLQSTETINIMENTDKAFEIVRSNLRFDPDCIRW